MLVPGLQGLGLCAAHWVRFRGKWELTGKEKSKAHMNTRHKARAADGKEAEKMLQELKRDRSLPDGRSPGRIQGRCSLEFASGNSHWVWRTLSHHGFSWPFQGLLCESSSRSHTPSGKFLHQSRAETPSSAKPSERTEAAYRSSLCQPRGKSFFLPSFLLSLFSP